MGWKNVRERWSQFLELYVHVQVKKLLHPGNKAVRVYFFVSSYKKTLLHLVFDVDVIDSPIFGRVTATV